VTTAKSLGFLIIDSRCHFKKFWKVTSPIGERDCGKIIHKMETSPVLSRSEASLFLTLFLFDFVRALRPADTSSTFVFILLTTWLGGQLRVDGVGIVDLFQDSYTFISGKSLLHWIDALSQQNNTTQTMSSRHTINLFYGLCIHSQCPSHADGCRC
jgi:hypothetical protein